MILELDLSPEACVALDRLIVNINIRVDDILSAALINYQQYLEICEDED